VVYTQAENYTPDSAYAVIIKPDGNRPWLTLATIDFYYREGNLFIASRKLPAGSYSYDFQVKLGSTVVKTPIQSGPTVN